MVEAVNVRSKNAGKFAAIQMMRGVAAMAVVVNHCLNQVTVDSQFLPREFFAFGVDIFFVISGFIMVQISTRKYASPLAFMRERFLRIYPMYFLFTSITALTIILSPSAVRHSAIGWSHYLLSIGFIPHINPATLTYSPLLRVGWTLNLEIYFYALFALAMAIRYEARLWLAALLILCVSLLDHAFPGTLGVLDVYADNIVFEFVFGMLLAKAFNATTFVWPRALSLGLALVAFALIAWANFLPTPLPRALGWGIPAAMLVWSALMIDRSGLGDICRRQLLFALFVAYLYPFGATHRVDKTPSARRHRIGADAVQHCRRGAGLYRWSGGLSVGRTANRAAAARAPSVHNAERGAWQFFVIPSAPVWAEAGDWHEFGVVSGAVEEHDPGRNRISCRRKGQENKRQDPPRRLGAI